MTRVTRVPNGEYPFLEPDDAFCSAILEVSTDEYFICGLAPGHEEGHRHNGPTHYLPRAQADRFSAHFQEQEQVAEEESA